MTDEIKPIDVPNLLLSLDELWSDMRHKIIEVMAIPPHRLSSSPSYRIGDCHCGYGWNCRLTGCRKPVPRDLNAWSDADA